MLIIMKSIIEIIIYYKCVGADHGGYVKRVGGVINAFSERKMILMLSYVS